MDIISKASVEGEILAPGTLEQIAGTPTEEGPFRAVTPRAAEQRVADLDTSIGKSVEFAEESTFDNKIEFKRALQERFNQLVLPELEDRYGITDSSELNDNLKEYLVDAYMNETLNAIAAYPDALGWYDSRITGAMSLMSLLHPELATDPDAASAFKIGLAITSNGNKVYDNFVEANRQYKYYKENGRFDESRSIGNQVGGILSNLKFANEALGVMSMAELTQFLTTKHKVGSLSYRDSAGKKKNLISGFGVNEEVYGAAVFGPKIGNGFFMNLYGVFDQLTMDRWFMRQYGRLTGTLLDFDQKKVDAATKRLARARKALLQRNSSKVEGLIGAFENLSDAELAQKVQKASVDIKKRAVLKSNPKLDELRKASNNLAKLLEAEVEAPTPAKRRFINEVFSELQQKLKDENGIDITIADLQAVNWYPEKALYQTFKADQTQKSAKTETSDNEQPDYESAARKLVEKQGVTKEQIDGRQIERDDTAREADQQRAAELLEDDEAVSQLRDRVLSTRNEITSEDLKPQQAAEQRVSPDTEGPTIVYRSGAVDSKAEPRGMMSGGRSTGHFGTGAYFFSDRKRAKEYDDRDVTAVDIRDYNLAPASKKLHDALRDVNTTSGRAKDEFSESDFFRVIMALGRYDEFYAYEELDLDASDEVLQEQIRRNSEVESRRMQLRADAKRMYNEPGNVDSRSTVVMKVLGYDGVYARPRSDMDNSTYGTVIYDVKTEPRAAEQRVAGPELAKVLQRYEFKPNNSLKNAELAPELRRNLKRFGFGVKQYGTRMNDFRVVSLDTGRAVDPNKLIEEGLAEGRAMAEDQRAFEAEQRARELEERIIEIYNADERPFTGKDFEARGVEQKELLEAMYEEGSIVDLIKKGRDLYLRDSSIKAVLLSRGYKAKDIQSAMQEYIDMFSLIPKEFGDVEGGLEVGRRLFGNLRRSLNQELSKKVPLKPLTKAERTARIEELRASYPQDKKLNDTQLLRRHPRKAEDVVYSMEEVRSMAMNFLVTDPDFKNQSKEVQEALVVGYMNSFKSRAGRDINRAVKDIRNNIRQRKKGATNAKAVRNELRKMLDDLLPAGKYTKAEAKALAGLVSNVTEDNMLVQVKKLTDLLEKKAKADIKAELRDIKKLDNRIRSERKYAEREARKIQKRLRGLINDSLPRTVYGKQDIATLNKLVNEVTEKNFDEKVAKILDKVDAKREQMKARTLKKIKAYVGQQSKKYKTGSGRVVTRGLDAVGQAFFEQANLVLALIEDADTAKLQEMAAAYANDPILAEATVKYNRGQELTRKEQALYDQKSAFDLFERLKDMTLEETEAVLEDLQLTAGFSRLALSEIRYQRARRLNALREGAKGSVTQDWGSFATNEDGSAKTQNQIESDIANRVSLGDALRANGLGNKLRSLLEWSSTTRKMSVKSFFADGALIHLGRLSNEVGQFFRDQIYKPMGVMEEAFLRGQFDEADAQNERANSIDGITKGYDEILRLVFASPKPLSISGLTTGSRKYTTDELMRIYALSLNDVQRKRLRDVGFTDEVMEQITDHLDDRLVEFVDKTVDYLSNQYYEGVNGVYRKVNDVNLGYVENYFPTKSATKGGLDIKTDDQPVGAVFSAQMADALRERTSPGELDLSKDLGFINELESHYEKMERFKAYAEGVQNINAVMRSPYYAAATKLIGVEKAMKQAASASVSPDAFRSDMKFSWIDKAISKFTLATLAFKAMQIPKQASSAFAALTEYQYGSKPNLIVDSIMFSLEYAALVPDMIARAVTFGRYKGRIGDAMEMSATFRSRMEGLFGKGDIYGLSSGTTTGRRIKSEKDYKKFNVFMRGLTSAGSRTTAIGDIAGVMGYMVTYNRDIKNGMSKEDALAKFNNYNETQQSRTPAERAPIQVMQDGLRRLITSFSSSQILYLNNTLRYGRNIQRGIRDGDIKAKDLRGLYFNAIGGYVYFTAISNVSLLLGSDDDRERYLREVLLSPIQAAFIYPVFGAAAERMYNSLVGKKYQVSIAVDPLERPQRAVTNDLKEGNYGTALTRIIETFYIGTNFDILRSLFRISEGAPIEDETYELLGVPKSQRPED